MKNTRRDWKKRPISHLSDKSVAVETRWLSKVAIDQCWRRVGARLEPKPGAALRPHCGQTNSMDGADVWAKTLAQLMAQAKPQDNWELVPQRAWPQGTWDSSGFSTGFGVLEGQLGGLLWGPGRNGVGRLSP